MMKTFKILAKLLFLYVPFIIFALLCINVFIKTFADLDNSTYSTLTSYGAAIIAGLGSVTFNWSRSVKRTEEFAAKQGERLLLASIGFLLQAGIKYGYVESVKQFGKDYPWLNKDSNFATSVQTTIAIVFAITFYILITTLLSIAKKLTSIEDDVENDETRV
ncbi:MAG: hypothetical protein P4L41_00615 [Flavipsychrobacter sp.]|nr:hypothetical protein [Flavipsychrobacter sp.]